ncbi:hypothetical protein CCH79_00009292 [Gambusia affinis]|uniref:Uncharacterized protein n=1 Tax=Gambusia affinis TaxID=33528 RepID=A0A315W487_GAMAF|nr:hypothetical protein CCH79_00009292 [Gambusia affinis]
MTPVDSIIAQIRKSTKPDQWHFVTTDQNPADHRTRAILETQLQQTTWLSGPRFSQEFESLKKGTDIPSRSPLGKLDPIIDGGLLKVGGRLQAGDLSDVEKNLVIIPVDPPFTRVGLDVFGPWNVESLRTRANNTDCKRWVVLFTCLSTRAVHIEVIQAMSTSSFINALRHFLSIR